MERKILPLIPITRSLIVEKKLDAAAKEYSFEREPKLDNKKILSIVAYSSGLSKDGLALADPSNSYLELLEKESNDAKIEIPLRSLIFTPGLPLLQFVNISHMQIDLQRSKVKFANTPVANTVLQLLIIYE